VTPTLAPGLLSSAPPANASPGIQPPGPSSKPASTAKSSTKTEGESPHESFATLLDSATQGADGQGGGETAALPAGSTPPPGDAPDVAELLARLVALAQGLADEGGATGPTESTEANLLLDRLAEAGGPETRNDGAGGLDALGAVEALMAYLVLGQQMPTDPDAATALPDDLVALLQQIEGRPSGSATDLELAAQQAVQAAVELTSAEPIEAPYAALDALDVTPSDAALAATSKVVIEADGSQDATADPAEGVLAAPVVESPVDGIGTASAVAAQPSTVERTDGVDPAASMGNSVGTAAEVDSSESDTPSANASVAPVDAGAAGTRGTEAAGVMMAQTPVEMRVVERVNATRVLNAATLPAEVADTVRTAVFHGDSEVRLVLNPPDLGHLDIHITRGEHGLRIVMEASQAGARDLIDRSITGLHQALEARDVRVDRLEVRATDTGRGSLNTSAGGQQSGGGAFNGSQGEDTPEWSPVAMLDGMNNETAGASQPEHPTDRDAAGVAGSVDVLA
jgi:flagellar hook-length control protein FliK